MGKGILFLSGGGSEKESYNLDKEFTKLLKKKLLYIPVAMNEAKHPYPDCLNWIKGVLGQFGFKTIEMWTDLAGRTLKELQDFDAIYIGGGNTFKLLKQLKDAKLDKLLVDYYKRGGNIYGGSAGAIILGKDISTALKEDVNEVELKSMKGLGLVDGFSIWCHYKPEEDNEIHKLVKELRLKIIALPENAGIIVRNKSIRHIGKALLFAKGKKRAME